jgi:hypothetical protein
LQVQQAAERFEGISHGHWGFACLAGDLLGRVTEDVVSEYPLSLTFYTPRGSTAEGQGGRA